MTILLLFYERLDYIATKFLVVDRLVASKFDLVILKVSLSLVVFVILFSGILVFISYCLFLPVIVLTSDTGLLTMKSVF